MRQVLFISDLHLQADAPKLTKLFEHFINNISINADAIYILGDLFEYWVGDDIKTEFSDHITQLLRRISQRGQALYILRGNRDFLLDKQFATSTGATMLADPTVIDCFQQRVVLTHGDAMCTDDKPHLRFRFFTERRFLRYLFLRLPIKTRITIAKSLREKSQRSLADKPAHVMDVTQTAVMQLFTRTQTNLMIHGHTHQGKIYSHENNSTRIVLDAWHERGNYCQFNEDGSYVMKWFEAS